MQVTEKMSRRVVHALMSQFTSVADAVNELVDNPIDYAEGQMVEVSLSFDRKRSRIIIESDGGRGMGPEDIQTFLSWGSGEHHTKEDIGFYGQGGKAACGFLARDLKLYAKKRAQSVTHMIEDIGWADRMDLKTFELNKINLADKDVPDSVRNAKKGRGHVRIELNHAHSDKRWNVETLKKHLACTYADLLRRGRLRIIVDTETLSPFVMPLDAKVDKVLVDVEVRGITLKGWAGKIDRSLLGDFNVKSGFKLITKGRVIRDGEWFGYNWQSKGALNQLVGELTIEGLTPNLNKTDFTERSNSIWDELSTEVISQLAPLIAKLRNSTEDVKVSKVEAKRAADVREELSRVIAELNNMEMVEIIGPGGRKKPGTETEGTRVLVSREGDPERKNQPRTEPPDEAVGSLNRVLGRVAKGKFPDIKILGWDGAERATLSDGHISVNKAHPAYIASQGSKSYVAETSILTLLAHDPENATPLQYLERANGLLYRWHQHTEAISLF